tara:strand:- start:1137 stop:2477 length:1341 start_codon:yes stop_codon:yes gene_type:complete
MVSSFDIIVAIDSNNGIGVSFDNKIPWKEPKDLAFFKNTTLNSVVIMGSQTYKSIGRTLPNRVNIVLSSNMQTTTDIIVKKTFEDAIKQALQYNINIFVIGGSKVYKTALIHPMCNNVIVTHIDGDYKCDVLFPYKLDSALFTPTFFRLRLSDTAEVVTYKNLIPEKWTQEMSYINLLKDVIENGDFKNDRTGVNTISLFSKTVEFDLKTGFPLLTTKNMYWRGIVEELLWFLRGSTNLSELKNKGVNIWNANGEDFHKKMGDDHDPDDLGYIYGHQWRNYGGTYDKPGIDQIQNLINTLKTNPSSRRLIVNAWNPLQMNYMALPPCHVMFQCYVSKDNLSLQMYQRSADIGLGLPFNIASYALLLHIIAHISGLKAHRLIIVIGDAHIYQNHIEPLKKQLNNNLLKLPKINLNFNKNRSLETLNFNDFQLIDYVSHPSNKMKMAV